MLDVCIIFLQVQVQFCIYVLGVPVGRRCLIS